jgi:hypothetical protein
VAASRVGRVHSPYQPATADDTAAGAEPGIVRLAWAGRTSTYDQQDPTLSLPRQLRACQLVLPTDALIVAHSYDIESGRKDLAARGRSDAHEMVSIPIHRDGGLTDMLAEDRPDCHEYHRRSPRRPEGTAVRVDVAGRSSRVAVGMWCVADRRVAGVRRRLDLHAGLDRQPPLARVAWSAITRMAADSCSFSLAPSSTSAD